MEMNEIDLIENFSKEELENILKIQIEYENYEGAEVVKSAINQYDECVFDYYIHFEDIEDIDNEL